MITTTQRSLAELRERGYHPCITEHWNAYARVKHDLFGFLDIVALHPEKRGILGIQTTTASNLSARVHKAAKLKAFTLWILSGNDVEFHGWVKKDNRWIVKKEVFFGS
jgi:hypothetical protein